MKRQFFAIILFLISFSFVFSTKSFALSCCPTGTAISPSGTNCAVRDSSFPFQCSGDEPICNSDTNTCVGEDTEECGNHNQLCCGSICHGDLVCIRPGQQGEACVTREEAAELPGNGTITPTQPYTNPIGIRDIFCIPGQRDSGIMTALGCIKTSGPNDLITSILKIATGVGGGIALALILYGVFIVTTSAGMPDKLKAGSEIITSAIIGLIFILLSVFLINLIGINILGIPGLSNT